MEKTTPSYKIEDLKMSIILEKMENAAVWKTPNVNHFEKIGKCCV